MAIVFSQVTVSCKQKSATFLVAGVPHKKSDLENWTKFQEFEKEASGNINIRVHTYEYGEGERLHATVEETAYMQMRLEANPSFLQTRCNAISTAAFLIPSASRDESVSPVRDEKTEKAIQIAQALLDGEKARDRGELDVSAFSTDDVIKYGLQRLAGALMLLDRFEIKLPDRQ